MPSVDLYIQNAIKGKSHHLHIAKNYLEKLYADLILTDESKDSGSGHSSTAMFVP